VGRYNLRKAHVLEVGSGEGLLQDIVEDYTGLDISATAKPKYQQTLCAGGRSRHAVSGR
jgi:hypothetical protein